MPRFYFPIVDGTRLDDPRGMDLENVEEAKMAAHTIARAVALTKPHQAWCIVIENDRGEEIDRLFLRPPVSPEAPAA